MNAKDTQRMFDATDLARSNALNRAWEIGARVATARYHHNEYLACRLSRLFKQENAKDAGLLDAFAAGYKTTYDALEKEARALLREIEGEP